MATTIAVVPAHGVENESASWRKFITSMIVLSLVVAFLSLVLLVCWLGHPTKSDHASEVSPEVSAVELEEKVLKLQQSRDLRKAATVGREEEAQITTASHTEIVLLEQQGEPPDLTKSQCRNAPGFKEGDIVEACTTMPKDTSWVSLWAPPEPQVRMEESRAHVARPTYEGANPVVTDVAMANAGGDARLQHTLLPPPNDETLGRAESGFSGFGSNAAYNDGDIVEYYCGTPNGAQWLLGTVRVFFRQCAGGTAIIYNLNVYGSSLVIEKVSLDLLRYPLEEGECVQVFIFGTWSVGTIGERQVTIQSNVPNFPSQMSYTVMHHDHGKFNFFRDVPADRLRRMFHVGDRIEFYRGSKLGWSGSIVVGMPAISTGWCQCRQMQCPNCTQSPICPRGVPRLAFQHSSGVPAHDLHFDPTQHPEESNAFCTLCRQKMRFTGRPCSDRTCCPWTWVKVYADDDDKRQGHEEMPAPPGCVLSAIVRRQRGGSTETFLAPSSPGSAHSGWPAGGRFTSSWSRTPDALPIQIR